MQQSHRPFASAAPRRCISWLGAIAWAALALPPAAAAETPLAVSPGDASKLAPIGDPCPTFSWGSMAGTRAYELVVYRLGEEGEEPKPVLRKSFAGSVSSWTPSLDGCLVRGGRYAWSIRGLGDETATDWSPASLFQVAAGPSAAEFEDALAVVRTYLGARRDAAPEAATERAVETADSSRRDSGGAPARLAPAGTQLSVDGNVDATTFTGDGSSLTGVATDAELATHAGEPAAHHPPTVDTTCNGAACDGASFTNLDAGNLTAGTLAEPRIDPAVTRDTELMAALDGLDCPAGHFLAQVDGGAPVCLTPFLEVVSSPSGGLAAEIPEAPGTQGPAYPYPSTLTVDSFSGKLVDVNVTLEGLSHTFPRDLQILLVAPTGQAVLLMGNVGGGGPGVVTVDLTFDDEAQVEIELLDNPTSGSYRPSGAAELPPPAPPGFYPTSLAGFDHIDPVGEWQLYIHDSAGGDLGSLGSWRLELTDGTNSSAPLPVAQGGTGASDGAGALASLGGAAALDLANHAAFVSAHHLPYTNAGAVAAMGAETAGNPLNHPRYTDAEVLAALSGTCIGRRWLDQGDGTVLDCNTGKFWLKDASCDALGPNGDGRATWTEAINAAITLADGACGLTDGSSPGAWRVPAMAELCSVGASFVTCPVANYATSLVDTRWDGSLTSPVVSNAAGDGQWSEGDPFVGVQGNLYWSATEWTNDTFAWNVGLFDGFLDIRNKGHTVYVWPVRNAL